MKKTYKSLAKATELNPTISFFTIIDGEVATCHALCRVTHEHVRYAATVRNVRFDRTPSGRRRLGWVRGEIVNHNNGQVRQFTCEATAEIELG